MELSRASEKIKDKDRIFGQVAYGTDKKIRGQVIVIKDKNKIEGKNVLRNELGLQVELISEKEITKILKILKEIRSEQKNAKPDPELEEMTKEIDAGYIERKLEKELTESEKIA